MDMSIGSRIAFLRDQSGWTQEELSSSLGITRAALSHYEKNRREPDTEMLTKLADLFHVSIDYLVGRTQNPQMTLDDDVRRFTEQLELTDADKLLESFTLTVDGRKLSKEEALTFIHLIRAQRAAK